MLLMPLKKRNEEPAYQAIQPAHQAGALFPLVPLGPSIYIVHSYRKELIPPRDLPDNYTLSILRGM